MAADEDAGRNLAVRILPVVLSSGFVGDEWGETEDERTAILAKPYRPGELVEVVRRFVASPRSA